jgi:hypothetical protein
MIEVAPVWIRIYLAALAIIMTTMVIIISFMIYKLIYKLKKEEDQAGRNAKI